MNVRDRLDRALRRLPLPVAVALAFACIIGLGILVSLALPPPRDLQAECSKRCAPRFSRLVPDTNYPMAKGQYQTVCECY